MSLLTMLWIRAPESRPGTAISKRHIGAEIREGLRWVLANRILRPLALMGPVCSFSLVVVWTMFLPYAVRDESLSPAAVGVIFSASSIGGVVGAAISGKVIKRVPLGLVYAGSMSAIFIGPLLIPIASGSTPVLVALFVLAFFISYLGLGVANVSCSVCGRP